MHPRLSKFHTINDNIQYTAYHIINPWKNVLFKGIMEIKNRNKLPMQQSTFMRLE